MSERELKRAAVLSRVAEGGWSLVQAAERMKVSYRQAKRLWKRYRAKGTKGLVHGNAGRVSNRAKAKSLRQREEVGGGHRADDAGVGHGLLGRADNALVVGRAGAEGNQIV